jgi:uncharacterized membrane protein
MTDPSQTNATQAGTRTWVRILLAVSLTVNLLVLGLVIGAHLRYGADVRLDGPPDGRSAMRDLGYAPFIDALPRDQRRALGHALRDRAGSFAMNREALARELAAILEVLRADPFTPDALTAVLDQQRARIDERARAGRELLMERIGAMSAAERQEFADRLETAFRRGSAREGR